MKTAIVDRETYKVHIINVDDNYNVKVDTIKVDAIIIRRGDC